MSSFVATPDSSARIESSRYGTSSRFTTKPGVSFARTTVLPTFSPKPQAASKTSSVVSSVRTTSTRRISGTGLKKCRPTKRSGHFVAAAMSPTASDDVFELKMVWSPQMPSSVAKRSFLMSRFSMMASTTRSQLEKSARSVVKVIFPMTAALSSSVILPFSTALPRNLSILPLPLARAASSTSRTTTSYPACAAICAMPDPMRPQPTTPTVLISIRCPLQFVCKGGCRRAARPVTAGDPAVTGRSRTRAAHGRGSPRGAQGGAATIPRNADGTGAQALKSGAGATRRTRRRDRRTRGRRARASSCRAA